MSFLVSLLTPFDARGRVDLAKLRAHVLWLSAHGVEGFVTCGAAGEFLYLSDREREAVQRTVLDSSMGKQVIACTWHPSPTTTAYLTDAAVAQGATAVLLPPPLFYDLDDDALVAWYRPVAEKGIRVLTLHDPEHITTKVSPARFATLREQGLVHGLVDGSDDPWRLSRLAGDHPGEAWAAHDRGLVRLRGIDGLAGFVSVLGNAWPGFCLRAWRGDGTLARAVVERHAKVQQAGGLRALKSLMRMGCRPPLIAPPDAWLEGLPPAESP